MSETFRDRKEGVLQKPVVKGVPHTDINKEHAREGKKILRLCYIREKPKKRCETDLIRALGGKSACTRENPAVGKKW